MKNISRTKFSAFINTVYKYKDNVGITTISFVKDLFLAAGCSCFPYSDESAKSFFNGLRTVPQELWDLVPKKINIKAIKSYFLDIINEKRLDELLEAFEISEDEIKDIDVLAESISSQFHNFVKYGEENSTSVKSIYEILIDEHNNGNIPNANEIALYSAKSLFLNALLTIKKIQPMRSLFEVKEPIESLLQNIYQIFRTFEAKCNRVGRIIYKSLQNTILIKDKNVAKYLKLVAEPGALPIDLVRLVVITVYDNFTFMDYLAIREFDLNDEDYTKQSLFDALKGIDIYDKVSELYFTEEMVFHLNNDDNNILGDIYQLILQIYNFLNKLEKEFKSYEPTKKLSKRIDAELATLYNFEIFTRMDGTCYTKKGKLTFAPNLEMIARKQDGTMLKTGDDKIKLDTLPKNIVGESFHDIFKHVTYYGAFLTQQTKGTDFMNECILFNSDGTVRYYMMPPTCPAKAFRMIREFALNAEKDLVLGFIYLSCVVKTYSNDILKTLRETTSEERMDTGHNFVVVNGYYKGGIYSSEIDAEVILKTGKIEPHSGKFPRMFLPLVGAIKNNEKKETQIKGLID